MKTKVFITIDVEFSISGAFSNPHIYQPVGQQAVLCEADGKSQGLGFLLETFERFGIPATFFIEVMNTHYFGDAPMAEIAHRIKETGHDLQLHLHPCWMYFKNPDWMSQLKISPPSDHLDRRSLQELQAWITEALSIYQRWGLARPKAMRTGSLMVDKTVYAAMEACQLYLASNVGVGVFKPAEPELQLYSGFHQIGQVMEACVTSYIDYQLGGKRNLHTQTVTGASFTETKALLNSAHAAGVESFVILTHCFEYAKRDPNGYFDIRPNRINQKRLQSLCQFISANPDRFEAATFCQLDPTSLKNTSSPSNTLLQAPLSAVALRLVENALNDRIRSF